MLNKNFYKFRRSRPFHFSWINSGSLIKLDIVSNEPAFIKCSLTLIGNIYIYHLQQSLLIHRV